jgi:hypothetical protein
MLAIDATLLDVTEWFCRWFQRLTGRTNVWLAFQLTNLSIVVFFVWAGMHFVLAPRLGRVAIAVFSGGLLYLLTRTIFKVPVEEYENSAYSRVAKGLRNPRRLRDAMLRVPFMTMSLSLPPFYPLVSVFVLPQLRGIFIVTYGLTVLTTVVLYLLACDPLPPCPGKLREWLSEFRLGLNPPKPLRPRERNDSGPHASTIL